MNGLQISVGAANNTGLLQLIIPAITTVFGNAAVAAAAIGGVWLTTRTTDRHRNDDARERRLEREDRRDSERLVVALHLEAFAKACAEVISHNSHPDTDDKDVQPIPDFPAWPDISWVLLGAKATAEAMDVQARVDLRSAFVNVDIEHMATGMDDVKHYYSKGAGNIGLEAWQVAERLRKAASVEPFTFAKDGWDYVTTLRWKADPED